MPDLWDWACVSSDRTNWPAELGATALTWVTTRPVTSPPNRPSRVNSTTRPGTAAKTP